MSQLALPNFVLLPPTMALFCVRSDEDSIADVGEYNIILRAGISRDILLVDMVSHALLV